MFTPTLAKEYTPAKIQWPAVAMPKLDGVRAVFRRALPDDEIADDGQYHFFSRGGQDKKPKAWNDNVIAHILNPLRNAIPADYNVVLDGEFYRHGWPCQRINGAIAVRRKEPDVDTPEIGYVIFDAAGPVAELPFTERMLHVAEVLDAVESEHIDTIETHFVKDEAAVAAYQISVLERKYEGVMLRNHRMPYEYKRTYNLQKFKQWMDAEFTCTGILEGRDEEHSVGGRLAGTLGALKLKTPEIPSVEFKCGSGFDDATRHAIWADPTIVIGKQITVKFFELTPDGAPRFPIFQAVRDYE